MPEKGLKIWPFSKSSKPKSKPRKEVKVTMGEIIERDKCRGKEEDWDR